MQVSHGPPDNAAWLIRPLPVKLVVEVFPCDIFCSDTFYYFTPINLLFYIFKYVVQEGRNFTDSITGSLTYLAHNGSFDYTLISVSPWAQGVEDEALPQKNILLGRLSGPVS